MPGPSSGRCRRGAGHEYLDKVIDVNQSPHRAYPGSTRPLIAGVLSTDIPRPFCPDPRVQDARLKARAFQLPTSGEGAAKPARGDGIIKIEMHFFAGCLCALRGFCKGRTTTGRPWRSVTKGKNIADVLWI